MNPGMLFSQMHPPEGREDEFHEWYNTEHIPDRMAIKGFSNAIRYQHDEGEPKFLAVYFLEDMAALETQEYRKLKENPSALTKNMLESVSGFTRYLTDQISDTGAVDPRRAGALYVVTFSVPVSDEEEFEDWYEGEHVPLLMKVPGWLRIRRYKARQGSAGPAWTHFALHEIDSPAALNAPERAVARDTAKRDALASREWFKSGRWVYTPIHYAFAAKETS